MHYIVCTSTAIQPITDLDLKAILVYCRHNNQRDGVTGLLLYSEEVSGFIQIIEGEKAARRALYGRIERNCRHYNIMKLADGPLPHRNLTTWSMGSKTVSATYFTQLIGYIAPQSYAFERALGSAHDELIQPLLKLFAAERAGQLLA